MRRVSGGGRRVGMCGRVVVLAAALLAAGSVRADIASDRPAAVIVFPKLLVEPTAGVDTLVRMSNTSNEEQNVLCFYVNVTPLCEFGLPGETCFPDPTDCSGRCVPQWQETDFQIRITARQPVAWLVSDGMVDCRFFEVAEGGLCSNNPATTCEGDGECPGGRCIFPPCFRLDGFVREGPNGQRNEGRVPPAPSEPFIGELKCVAVDETGAPIGRNTLKGEALIGRIDQPADAQIAGYNAIGIPAVTGEGNRDSTLVLGGPRGVQGGRSCTNSSQCPNGLVCINRACDNPCRQDGTCAEYEGCPNILILNHFFDGGVDPIATNECREGFCTISLNACGDDDDCTAEFDQVRVGTDLTLIPCTQDFRTQNPDLSRTVAQFLVFNEFEQRFSTSRTVNCFREDRLSNLDTPQNERSIFSAGVAGTLTGQTRIRGVDEGATDHGNTLIGIAEEFRCAGDDFPLCSFIRPEGLISSNAVNVHIQGTRRSSDFLYLP